MAQIKFNKETKTFSLIRSKQFTEDNLWAAYRIRLNGREIEFEQIAVHKDERYLDEAIEKIKDYVNGGGGWTYKKQKF